MHRGEGSADVLQETREEVFKLRSLLDGHPDLFHAGFVENAMQEACEAFLVHAILGDDYDRPDGHCRLGPEWLVLVVNNFCNLHCRMCDVGLGESASVFWTHMIGDDRRNMSLEMLVTILDQASAFRPRPRIGLAFTEPLIHPRIVDFCRAAVDRGFFCSGSAIRLPKPPLGKVS